MRDHRERKRAVAGRAKQHRVRRNVQRRRRHQPLLHAVWLAFCPLRTEGCLRRGGLRTGCHQHSQSQKRC
jgi:hypothetical protein